ncbi:MAG: DUF5667 domain-containing protein [Chloroflexota bacterium]
MKVKWDEVLDESLERLLSGEATLEECLQRYPQHADRLAGVLRTALTTRDALRPAAPPRQPTSLPPGIEAKLRAMAARRMPPSHRPRPAFRHRPSAALAAVMMAILLLGASTAVAWAAQGALPNDLLYPVKRGLEEARLALNPTEAGDAALLEVFVQRRLDEIQALMTAGREEDLPEGLAEYGATLDRLLALAGEFSAEDGPGPLVHIDEILGRHLEVLERVRSQAPEEAQQGLDQALERSRHSLEVIEQVLQGEQRQELVPGWQDHGRPTDKPAYPGWGNGHRTPGPPWRTPDPPTQP